MKKPAKALREARKLAELNQRDPESHMSASERAHLFGEMTRILALTPAERLLELKNAAQFVAAARRVSPPGP